MVYSCTGVNIAEPSLSHCQYLGAFIAPFPTEKNKILIIKSSLRHYLQIPNLFKAPLPTTVYVVNKRPLTEQCLPLAICLQIAVQDGAVTLKGFPSMGVMRIFLKIPAAYS